MRIGINHGFSKKNATMKKFLQLPYLPIIIAPIILFSPLMLSGEGLYWGTPFLQFVPWRVLAFNMMKSGSLPLWNSLSGMGAPLLANYQSAFFYPTTWFLFGLEAVGGTALMAWGQTIVVIFHLVLSGIGMALLCKRLRLNIFSQTIAGLAFSLSGYLVARAGFLSINAAVAWLPWIILAANRIAGPFGPNAITHKLPVYKITLPLMACLVFQLLAGHAQTTYYTILFLFAWIVVWGYLSGKMRGSVKAAAYLVLSLTGAILISSIQLIPTLEYLLQSQRASSISYDMAVNYSFFPWRFLTLIAPNIFGTPAQGNYLLHADNYWEDAVYIGFIPIILAVAGFWQSIRQKNEGDQKLDLTLSRSYRKLAVFLLATVVISFLLALGKYFPLFPFLYR